MNRLVVISAKDVRLTDVSQLLDSFLVRPKEESDRKGCVDADNRQLCSLEAIPDLKVPKDPKLINGFLSKRRNRLHP